MHVQNVISQVTESLEIRFITLGIVCPKCNHKWAIKVPKEDFKKELPVMYLTCFVCNRIGDSRNEKKRFIREVCE